MDRRLVKLKDAREAYSLTGWVPLDVRGLGNSHESYSGISKAATSTVPLHAHKLLFSSVLLIKVRVSISQTIQPRSLNKIHYTSSLQHIVPFPVDGHKMTCIHLFFHRQL